MKTTHLSLLILAGLSLGFSACSSSPTDSNTSAEAGPAIEETAPAEILTCRYDNPFSREFECKEYLGLWDQEVVDADCGEIFTGVSGTIDLDGCDKETAQGTCTVVNSDDQSSITYYYGGDLEVTASMCASFLNGTWQGSGDTIEEPESELNEALNAMLSTDTVTVSPECIDDTCVAELASNEEGIWFSPNQAEANTGIVFYPGGGVDPRAYAPAAQILASSGLMVVIVPMPGNFAFNGYRRATTIMAAQPSITSWFIAGHSAGGAAAIKFATESRDEIDGMILLAAYGDLNDDLTQTNMPVLSVYGTEDGVSTVDEIEAGKQILPDSTLYIPLHGGNHAQFGYYGDQNGDNPAYISQAHQHGLFTGAMSHFIASTQATDVTATHPGFTAAANLGLDWCKNAQAIIAGLENEDGITITTSEDLELYSESKPSVDGTTIEVRAFSSQSANPTELRGPSIIAGEIWCKMKMQEALPESIATPNSPGTCKHINEAALAWALTQLSPEETERYEREAPSLTFEDDSIYETGFEWIQQSQVELTENSLRSSRLTVELDREDLPEQFRGVHYCKTWSPASALLWILTAQ